MTLTTGVVVCAYTLDRWDDIVLAIESLEGQRPAPAQVVLVIDHNAELLERALASWSGQHTVVANAGARGLSGARNTGIAWCGTDIVAFLDDDAAARPGWLAALAAPYVDPMVAATGGVALPRWPGVAEPATIPVELRWVVGCTYEGQPTVTADVRNVMGCSMSFRGTTLAAVGGFTDGIGRLGARPLGCEETELCIRIHQHDADARVVFVPDSVVDHRVGVERTGWSYLIRRSYAEGLSKAAIGQLVGAHDALATERAYTRSVLPRGIARELRARRLLSALAIVVSVACAAAGYLRPSGSVTVTGAGPLVGPGADAILPGADATLPGADATLPGAV